MRALSTSATTEPKSGYWVQGSPLPWLPVFFGVVLRVACFVAHHVHDGFRIALVAGAECRGKPLGDKSHHSALFRIENAAERGKALHRDSDCGDRGRHVAALAGCDRVAKTCANFGDSGTRTFTDHNLQFTEILCQFCERIVCGIILRHYGIVSSVQV